MKYNKRLRVLVACEESQAVCIAFRNRGHEAYSCDVLTCSGGHPEWHIQDDVLKHLDEGWDMMIAFPPCTYLTVAGACRMYKKDGSIDFKRLYKQFDALMFIVQLMDAPIEKIAIENPIGVVSSNIREPDQIIQPYYFGDEAQKTTCLWLKNLPLLYHNAEPNLFEEVVTHVGRGEFMIDKETGRKRSKWLHIMGPSPERAKLRSKTFPGIAQAMASQWSEDLMKDNLK
jgi:hypothetical protein